MTEIFVPVVGQYDNIGDVILRRALMRWLQSAGTVHAYVGRHAPHTYVEGLGIDTAHRVYLSLSAWGLAAARCRSTAQAYVFKPGEIQLTLKGMKEHVGLLPLLLAVKARDGQVLRIGVGARNRGSVVAQVLVRPSVRLSDQSYWRDEFTRSLLRRGTVMPDLAFAEGSHAGDLEARAPKARPILTVSLRGDRPPPSEGWIRTIRAYARDQGLGVVVAVQVRRDGEAAPDLARRLRAELIAWDARSHVEQEFRLRSAFGESALVLSDRLHVLVAGLTEGAAPAAVVERVGPKIERHFATAGMFGVAADCADWAPSRIGSSLQAAQRLAHARVTALARVRQRLESVRREVCLALA